MDLVRDRTSNVAEEDRISKLPDDIIHRILGFLDMKYAVQTSKLSKRWKFIWTSMPDLNLNFHTFGDMYEFAKFVKHVISHRNHSTQVSAVKLTFRGLPTGFVVNRVIDYTYTRNIRQLTMIWFPKKAPEFPLSIFRSHTLKHLTLKTNHVGRYSERAGVPQSAWDFPALETLHLSDLFFNGKTDKNINLFPKCVNLKELTLHKCSIYHVDVFNICAPQLSKLTITQPRSFAKAFNVVAPQLENLTASVLYEYFDTSILSSEHIRTMQLSTEGLDFLEKVNLLIPRRSKYCLKNIISTLLDLFQKLRGAKVLIINLVIVEVLSLYLDQDLHHEPCPFNNLKCLKIDDMLPLSLQDHEKDRITKMVSQVRKYFLENSPTATVINLIPVSPVRVKRPRGLVDNHATANKVAKLAVEENKPETMAVETRNLEAKIQTANKVAKLAVEENKPETMVEETRNLEAEIQMLEQVNAKQKNMFEAKSQMQDEVIAEQKTKVQMQDEVIAEQKAKIQMQDKIIADQKVVGQATIQMQDEVITKQKAMFEAKMQMQDEGIAEQKAMFDAKIQMQDELIANQKNMFVAKIQMQDAVIAEQKAKIQMQDENIAKQKTIFDAKIEMLEAAKLQQEKLTSLVIKCKIAELKVQLESGHPDYEFIRSMGSDIKSVMGFIPESLRVAMETQFSFQYVELKSLFFTRFDASQWAKIETELGYTRDSQTS